MKLLLFILGITLITTSPTLRGLQSIDIGESGENTEGIFVVFQGEEDVNAELSDSFSFSWIFGNDEPNNGESGESNLEQALEEENVFFSEESLPDLLTQVRDDPVTSGILDFGVSTVITSGVAKGKIPNIPFTVTSISALTKTTSDEGDLYDFSCEAVNQNGNSVIEMNFTVYYDFSSERRILSSYSFKITTTTVTPSNPSGPENEYVQVSEADIETDAVVQDVLEYGIAQIYTIGTQAGKIPVSEFVMAKIVSVWKQETATGANYQCEVVLKNNNNATVNANFTVAYVENTQQSTLTSYQFTVNIINVPTPPSNNTTTNSTTGFVVLSTDEISSSAEVQAVLAYGVDQILLSGYTSGKIPQSNYDITNVDSVAKKTQANRIIYQCQVELEDVNQVLIVTNFTVYVNVSSQGLSIGSWSYNVSNIATPGTPIGSNYTFLNETEIANNAEVQAVLAYGVNQILQSGYAKGKIPVSQYNITDVFSVAFMNGTTRNTYNCRVELQDANKVTIDAEFNVYVKANQTLAMGSWAYNVTTSRNPTNPTGPTNNTNTTTPTQPTNTTNSTTPTGPTNTTQPSNTTNTTTPVGNNTSTNTTTADGFTALSADEIQSAQVQAVLAYGVNQILQSGYAKGKIPVSQYNITNVNSVLEKIEAKRTTYRCAVVLSGANKANISALYDVYVQNSNYSMGGWTYNLTTIRNPTNPTNTTNSTNTTTPTQPTNTTGTNTTTPTGPTNTTQPTNTTDTNTTTPTGPTNTTQPTNTTNTTTPVGNNTSTNTTTNATTGGWTALSADEIQSTQVQVVLTYGTNQLIQSGNAKGKIPVSVYNITKVNSVLTKAVGKSTVYQCDVELQDANKVTIDAVFNVSVNATQGLSIAGWTYSVTSIKKPQNNTNTTTPTTPVTSNTTTNTSVNTNNNTNTNTNTTNPTNNSTNTTNTTTPVVTNNSTNTTGNSTNSNFTALTVAEIQTAEVQAVLNYGANQIIQSGNAKGKIPVSQYSISRINSVAVNTQPARTTYEADVQILGANKLIVNTQYSVYVNATTQAKSMGPWSYATSN